MSTNAWCYYHIQDNMCSAHCAEDRYYKCPYTSAKDSQKQKFPCLDYLDGERQKADLVKAQKRPRTPDEIEDDRCFGPLPQEDILREDLRAITTERDLLKAELEATVDWIMSLSNCCPPGMTCHTNGYVNRFGELSTCRDCVRDHLDKLAKDAMKEGAKRG